MKSSPIRWQKIDAGDSMSISTIFRFVFIYSSIYLSCCIRRMSGHNWHGFNQQNNPDQVAYARALYERVRRECIINPPIFCFPAVSEKRSGYWLQWPIVPELRIYRFFEGPLGPHPIAMFEVNIFTPAQFGAFIPWLIINRGPLSALLHPNTDEEEEERNHTQRATWLGDKIPLDLRVFKLMKQAEKKNKQNGSALWCLLDGLVGGSVSGRNSRGGDFLSVAWLWRDEVYC